MSLRPQSLKEVADRADELRTFGWEFQDWLHTVRAIRSRPALLAAIQEEPPLLANRFPEGNVADAWLAAYAEQVSQHLDYQVPDWANRPNRVADKPWFSTDGKQSRLLALRDSPPAFKNRNLFTHKVDLPIRLRAGRPPVSAEQKRQKNVERQRRFRLRRSVELELLRTLVQAE